MAGYIIYEGPSELDGKPIVAIATYSSKNRKTGPMVQTWILRADIDPVEAVSTGQDISICGDCPHRGTVVKIKDKWKSKDRTCYVKHFQAPLAIWRAYKRGAYRQVGDNKRTRKKLMGMGLRYGSYGEPTAVPLEAWGLLDSLCTGKARTGYTHQWAVFPWWRSRLMASVESVADATIAHKLGWRTFRLGLSKQPGEMTCPASEEEGKRLTCVECKACNGSKGPNDQRVSVVIAPHGNSKRIALSLIS